MRNFWVTECMDRYLLSLFIGAVGEWDGACVSMHGALLTLRLVSFGPATEYSIS
jgi:hypothetical protein